MMTNDGPEGHIISNDELKRLWVLGYSPFDIARMKGIPLKEAKEIFRRLKREVQQPLVEKGKVIQ